MKVTIKDIAKMAGVSPATVSKIINNYKDVGEETRQKVLDIMEQTGYRPSYSARSLAMQTSNIIGVIYAGNVNADFNHPFFIEVMNSFKKSIGSLGYDLLFFSNEKFNGGNENYLERCRHYQVDGCIVISGEEIQSSILDLVKSEIPCIGVDLQLDGKRSSYIMSNNVKVGKKVVEHFYLLGYRDIGFIGGIKNSPVTTYRLEGFKKKMADFGLVENEDWVTYGDYFEESGYQCMLKMLQAQTLPRAIFAASDLMAFGALRAVKERGLRVPEDIAIVGCDDIDACKYTEPPLTSIKQDKNKIGKLAAYMLVDLIEDHVQSTNLMVEPELVIRKSCGSHLAEH
ncbi:LacI family DNA-binding transcriptional regulator [Cytobacillus sp. IB215665]|uniref:LacI family DNA-binding transcriptional regulator n=1 Tax=Cytobacillus sp. IB215665 TaxID=3097357 RepID=UPI002A125BFB|nr:LacI family DNA-binding transcriptional regulator [Cytobacillus sp. IB215665]MDX8364554.1 LacI family DNA-binding transcriptional regulator [Cytobacillus sp. IB215665]